MSNKKLRDILFIMSKIKLIITGIAVIAIIVLAWYSRMTHTDAPELVLTRGVSDEHLTQDMDTIETELDAISNDPLMIARGADLLDILQQKLTSRVSDLKKESIEVSSEVDGLFADMTIRIAEARDLQTNPENTTQAQAALRTARAAGKRILVLVNEAEMVAKE